MPSLSEDERKEVEEVQSQLNDLMDKPNGGHPKREDVKAAIEEVRDEGVKEGKKAALKSILAAMTDEDERQKLHDKVDASDDEEMKKVMNEMHSKKGKNAATAMDPEEYLKKSHHLTDSAKMASLEAKLERYENEKKEEMVVDLVALKASIVPNVDEGLYHKQLMELSYEDIESYHQGRQDEIEAMRTHKAIAARMEKLAPSDKSKDESTKPHPNFAFNARALTTTQSRSNLHSLDDIFNGAQGI